MKTIKKDESFVCKNCGKKVLPLGYTSRDHCPFCLSSLHVDNLPGDRLNTCHGILKPIAVDYNGKKGYSIVFKCEKCGAIKKNVCAKDDDFEKILEIMKNA